MNLFVKASGSAIPDWTLPTKVASSSNVPMQLLIALGAAPPRFLTISATGSIGCHYLSNPCHIIVLIGIEGLAITIELLRSVGSVRVGHITVYFLSVTTALSLEVVTVPEAVVVDAASVVISSSEVASIRLNHDRSLVSSEALLIRV